VSTGTIYRTYLPLLLLVIRVVLTPRNDWMRSGSAVDAHRMHSGSEALRLLWLKQKKTGVPMTAPQNRPKILRTPHHLHPREFLREIGAKLRKSPQFCPSSLPCRNYSSGFTGCTAVMYWRRSPFTYVSYFTIMYVSKTLLLLAVAQR
jgi:hypothetical protein